MKHTLEFHATALAPIVAVSLVLGLGAALSERAAPRGDTVTVPSGGFHENVAAAHRRLGAWWRRRVEIYADRRQSPDA